MENEIVFDNPSSHIDTVSASLAARARPQLASQVRMLDQQTLDALLRIEELMSSILAGLRHFAKQQDASFGKPVETGRPPQDVAEIVEAIDVKAKGTRGKR